MVLYPYRHHRKDHHDQTHHTNRHNRCHTRTHHRLHHRTTNRPTTRQRTTLHHHHIITMQILPRRRSTRPSRPRHIHRSHRHTMVSRRPKPIQHHRLVNHPIHSAAFAALFLCPKPQQHKTTKTNKTKHHTRRPTTKQGGAKPDTPSHPPPARLCHSLVAVLRIMGVYALIVVCMWRFWA